MDELDVTWRRSLSVWWLVVWRGMVGAVVIGFVAGFVWALTVTFAGGPKELASVGSTTLGLIVGLVWGAIALRMALRKRYSGFRIVLVPCT